MTIDQPAPAVSTSSTASHPGPLHRVCRRILGVLVEKAKTTPDAYPLSLNALTTGCNQKSNRDPQMNLSAEEVEEYLDVLRDAGAVAEVQGGGRVARYRHYLYEWLGVDKQELAVMAELLLRGAQTIGELRGRAARMEPIANVQQLLPIVQSLIEKGLVVPLTPAGRGQIVCHTLLNGEELDKVHRKLGIQAGSHTLGVDSDSTGADRMPASAGSVENSRPRLDAAAATPAAAAGAAVSSEDFQRLKAEVQALREQLDALVQTVTQLQNRLDS